MLARFAVLFAFLFAFASEAFAEVKIATVDFQKAINEVSEGQAAKQRLESMYADKRAALQKMQADVAQMEADYQKQSIVLSEEALKAKQQELYNAQMQLQQAAMRSEGEMQEAYMAAMDSLLQKMRVIAEAIGKEKGYTLVLEVTEGGVIYSVSTIDITGELITRYNAQNPGK